MPKATLFQITARYRLRQFMPTALADFTTDAGVAVDATVVLDPAWSLYCLDLEGEQAVFVRLPLECDLSAAAFIPQAQFDAALAVLTLPLQDLPGLAQGLAQPDNLIFVFSIGRCGTTLANHILNTVPQTYALSEPRAFVTLAMARHDMAADRAKALIAAVTRFMYRPPQGRVVRNFAVKLHSQALYQADLYHQAFPKARCIFMYRDAKGWANSFSRFLQNLGNPLMLDPDRLRSNWAILTARAPLADLSATLDVDAPQTTHAPLLAAAWAHNMATQARLATAGVPFFPLHYNDLTDDRTASIRALLAHCDLSASMVPKALAQFDHDSQEGTAIGRGSATTGFGAPDYDTLITTLARTPQPIQWDIRL